MTTGIIPDGYSLDGYVEGVDRLFPPVRFIYRPATRQETAALTRKSALRPNDEETLQAEFTVERLTDWDLKWPDGKPVDVTTENYARLQPLLYQRLFHIIAGVETSDVDPDAGKQSVKTGDDAAKNSEAA